MSNFRRSRVENQSPELQLLLAQAASRQSQSPTAMAFYRSGRAASEQSAPSEIAFFAGAGHALPAQASFSPSAAKALVTEDKSL